MDGGGASFNAPFSGTVESVGKIIGEDLYSVKPAMIRSYALDVLTRNKRQCLWLRSQVFGLVAFVVVGATHVGSIVINAKKGDTFEKGDELGHFAYGGSTIVMVFSRGRFYFDTDLIHNSERRCETLVQLGQTLGYR
ncbi:phosphatidylserine decarboxylase [Cymbomonas tetramitiformis]|uniref:Phosphatidylserine decarboxylase n=1 Tax=Cymbomonas tetramitiformis TaxID=36881 RepID=A0AAE0FJ61_9CHLO|nr:phosphatidylserine decarboxylase [Cymbomonas tetramitiformis]